MIIEKSIFDNISPRTFCLKLGLSRLYKYPKIYIYLLIYYADYLLYIIFIFKQKKTIKFINYKKN